MSHGRDVPHGPSCYCFRCSALYKGWKPPKVSIRPNDGWKPPKPAPEIVEDMKKLMHGTQEEPLRDTRPSTRNVAHDYAVGVASDIFSGTSGTGPVWDALVAAIERRYELESVIARVEFLLRTGIEADKNTAIELLTKALINR